MAAAKLDQDMDAMTTVGTGASGPITWKAEDKEACKMLATMLMGNMPRACTGPARVLRGQMMDLAKVVEDLIADSDKVDAVSAHIFLLMVAFCRPSHLCLVHMSGSLPTDPNMHEVLDGTA